MVASDEATEARALGHGDGETRRQRYEEGRLGRRLREASEALGGGGGAGSSSPWSYAGVREEGDEWRGKGDRAEALPGGASEGNEGESEGSRGGGSGLGLELAGPRRRWALEAGPAWLLGCKAAGLGSLSH